MSMPASVPAPVPPRSGPMLTLHLAPWPAGRLVTVRGELDMSTTHLLTELVDELVRRPVVDPPLVILDLTGVTFFCAAGVNALLTVQHTLRSRSIELVLCGMSRRVRRILDITGDGARFDVRPAAEALGTDRAAETSPGRRTLDAPGITVAQVGTRPE